MIYGLSGVLLAKKPAFVVVDVGGVHYKIAVSPIIIDDLPPTGEQIRLFTYLAVREDSLDLYGFLKEAELFLFEKLLSVNGIGPKSALAVMAIAPAEQLAAAIGEGKADLLTRVSGIGKKTADRIILELKGKLPRLDSEKTIREMESDKELEEALAALGYSQLDIKKAVASVKKTGKLEDRLREVLKGMRGIGG